LEEIDFGGDDDNDTATTADDDVSAIDDDATFIDDDETLADDDVTISDDDETPTDDDTILTDDDATMTDDDDVTEAIPPRLRTSLESGNAQILDTSGTSFKMTICNTGEVPLFIYAVPLYDFCAGQAGDPPECASAIPQTYVKDDNPMPFSVSGATNFPIEIDGEPELEGQNCTGSTKALEIMLDFAVSAPGIYYKYLVIESNDFEESCADPLTPTFRNFCPREFMVHVLSETP
jgi:hypothetical protein